MEIWGQSRRQEVNLGLGLGLELEYWFGVVLRVTVELHSEVAAVAIEELAA